MGLRGCFGCCGKPPKRIDVDRQLTRGYIQSQRLEKFVASDDFWSHAAATIDNDSELNQPLEPRSDSNSTDDSAEFVNQGLVLWNKSRQQWLGKKGSQDRTQAREPIISWNTLYESLLGTNEPLPRLVPLTEMVDFLVDVWQDEGLYDYMV